MAILTEHVDRYLQNVRPDRSRLMAEMEKFAETDHVPIVHWETGRFLATMVRATDPALVLEVGTAIGYSTQHMAQELGRGKIVTLERDPDRIRQATDYLERAGLKDRVEIVEGDATETLAQLTGPFDFIFLDGTKTEYMRYLEMAEQKAAEHAVLVVDNMLMSGDVGLEDDSEAFWSAENLASARKFNEELVSSERWLGAVLPIGDGVVFAARR